MTSEPTRQKRTSYLKGTPNRIVRPKRQIPPLPGRTTAPNEFKSCFPACAPVADEIHHPSHSAGDSHGVAIQPDFPEPSALNGDPTYELTLDRAMPEAEEFRAIGRKLRDLGFFRVSKSQGGLLFFDPKCPSEVRHVKTGQDLATLLVDLVRIRVLKDGEVVATAVPASRLEKALRTESLKGPLRQVDRITHFPTYLPGFRLTAPGWNDGGFGQRVWYNGDPAPVSQNRTAMDRFLDQMPFESNADRTNLVAAALTVELAYCLPGGRPLVYITATKSQAGKDTCGDFVIGQTPVARVGYEAADWAFKEQIVKSLLADPLARVVAIENARLGDRSTLASAELERVLTDRAPNLFTPRSQVLKLDFLTFMLTTNDCALSTDLLNRSLPVFLNPTGNMRDRQSPIGNPRFEYLPLHAPAIRATLRWFIENWKNHGQPLARSVRHTSTEWAQIVGGILEVNGFRDFLGNLSSRLTDDDPVRRALGTLGVALTNLSGEWMTPTEIAVMATDHGLVRDLLRPADRDKPLARARGMGKLLSRYVEETFEVEKDESLWTKLVLEKRRVRFVAGQEAHTRYRFRAVRPVPGLGQGGTPDVSPSAGDEPECLLGLA